MGKEWGKLPRGVTVREFTNTSAIQISFTYIGIRCRETISLPVNRRNINYATNLLGEIKASIERKTFKYADYFPDSPRLKIFGQTSSKVKTVIDYLDDFQQAAIKRGLSPSTIEGYRKLKLSLIDLHLIPVNKLTPSRLKEFVKSSNNTSKTIRNKFSYLRSALAEAVTDGVIDINPVDGIKISNYTTKNNKVDHNSNHQDIRPFSPSEIQSIYEHCRDDEINIVKLIFNTGLRSSEWSALRWSDVDMSTKCICVKSAIVHGIEKGPKSKSGKRTIPLNDIAYQALHDQKCRSYLVGDFVFPKYTKARVQLLNGELNRVNPESFRKHRWIRILKEANVPYRYPYQMRHTFATMHISQGMNLWKLANWMGHASPEMIFNHYGKFIEDHQKVFENNDTPRTRKK